MTVPWGITADWNLFVAPREMGREETPAWYENDNALLKLRCHATPIDGSSWRITAEYKFKAANDLFYWAGGTANYLLVPK